MSDLKDLNNIPSSQFEFANVDEKIHDKKFDTKPVGYFKDALNRFRKNKASVAAFFIICLIVLYAIIMPFCINDHKKSLMDNVYSKKAPRIEWFADNLGILDGGSTKDYSEKAYIFELAKGVAAEYDGKTVISLADSLESKYSPLNKLKAQVVSENILNKGTLFKADMDEYLKVGFSYQYLSLDEIMKLAEWEKETGNQIFYPLIAENEYNAAPSDANYWYKSQGGTPVKVINADEGIVKKLSYSDDLVLEENYLRDSEGNLVYQQYTGSGEGHEQYKTRVLYYNYYYAKHGFRPNYLFGTDAQGYDLAYRVAQGIQLSIVLALIVSLLNFVIGAIYGAVEGYYGGTTDLILERVADVLSGVPFVVAATLFQLHLAKRVGAIPSLIFAFVATGWIGTARRVRTQFYRFKNQEYVMAAKTLGARDRRIIWKHIFPNTLGTLITSSVLVIPSVIFSESMLSFLGIVSLGGAESTSLGTLLSSASKIWMDFPHLMLFPAIIISLLMISFNLLGNGLRDAFNPSLRGVDE